MATPKPFVQIGLPFIKLSGVDSTNNYALNLIKTQDAINGTVIFADYQTNGKGQTGKQWKATANQNILTSIILDISTIHVQNQFCVLAMAALGAYHFFEKYCNKQTAIKWSNDIYFKDNKAGGILIETTQKSNKRFAIIGIGLNINQTEFENNINATSLKLITNKNYNVSVLTQELIAEVGFWYNKLLNSELEEIHEAYNKHLFKKDKQVMLKKGNIKFAATIKSVNKFGELMVDGCIYEKFSFGEVLWLL